MSAKFELTRMFRRIERGTACAKVVFDPCNLADLA